MNAIHTFADLEQFGINALTGEACAYSMRVLCDLNADGAVLVADWLGLLDPCPPHAGGKTPFPFAPNWNSTVDGKPAIGSVMLDRDCLERLAVFACFRTGALAVATATGAVVPIEDEETLGRYGEYVEQHRSARLYRNPHPGAGSRNVHMFTGRNV
jgi:hypothetical protein